MKKKSKILLGSSIGLLVVLAVLIVIVLDPFKSNEDKAVAKIETIGSVFYEEFFYPQQVLGLNEAQTAQKLTVFSTEGITISLEDINKVKEIGEKIEAPMSDVTSLDAPLVCDPQNTKVTVIPNEPFGKTNYTIKVTLDCK